MVTIEQAHDTMLTLYEGDLEPSMVQALWNAAMSKHMPFESNLAYARTLRPFREVGLPSYDGLFAALKTAVRDDGLPAYGLTGGHARTLIEIELADMCGQIDLDYGHTLASQRAWRDRIVEIWGVGYKVASWALQLYDMKNCKLMAIDTIHCHRLDLPDAQKQLRKTEAGRAFYHEMEDYMLAECKAHYPEYPVASTAAWLWFNQRGGIVPHVDLSCRIGV